MSGRRTLLHGFFCCFGSLDIHFIFGFGFGFPFGFIPLFTAIGLGLAHNKPDEEVIMSQFLTVLGIASDMSVYGD
jgi:hypothetical protein